MSLGHGAGIVRNGLVLHLDAANSKSYIGTGTNWADLSGNTYNGTLIDGPTFSSSNSGSFAFDGLNDRVHLTSTSDRWSWTPSGNGLNFMTVEIVFKSNDTNSGYILSKPWNGSGEYNWTITQSSFNTLIGNQSHSLTYTSLASTNWQHLCAIITPTQKSIYRNGVLYAGPTNHSTTNNTPTSGNASVELCLMSLYPYGSGWAGNTGFSIEGNLAAVKIYNRALLATEVRQNFEALRGRYGI